LHIKVVAQKLEKQLGISKSAIVVLKGDPAKEILTYARAHEPDLIVMGAHGEDRVMHQAMGNVTRTVMDSSSCSVVVINAHKARQVCFDWNAD
jgi:nucleotide-binding universal stress UspA family protein